MRTAVMTITLLLLASWGIAQYRVGGPERRRAPGDPRIDMRVGRELYGNEQDPVRRYFQTQLLPSERRYAEMRSGALPSEIRMNETAAGPLDPYGSFSQIPTRSPLQTDLRMRTPRLYNPAYGVERQLAEKSQGDSLQPPTEPEDMRYGGVLRRDQRLDQGPQLYGLPGPLNQQPLPTIEQRPERQTEFSGLRNRLTTRPATTRAAAATRPAAPIQSPGSR